MNLRAVMLSPLQLRLIELWQAGKPTRVIGDELGISDSAVSRMSAKLRLSGVDLDVRERRGRDNHWTPEEDRILAELIQTKSNSEIAEIIGGRSEKAVQNRRAVLGLKKIKRKSQREVWEAFSASSIPRPSKPKGYSPSEIKWAWENIDHPEAKAVLAMHVDWLKRTRGKEAVEE
jgi:DNA-binding CsgD family transcriptional regulator